MEIEEIIPLLESLGVISIMVPLLVIFTLLFVALNQSKLFSKKSNIVIAACLSLISVILHVVGLYHPCWDLVVIIRESLPQVAILFIGVISLVVVSSIIGLKLRFLNRFKGYSFFIILALIAYAFLTTGEPGCYQISLGLDLFEKFEYLIFLLFIMLLLWILHKILPRPTGRKPDEEDPELY